MVRFEHSILSRNRKTCPLIQCIPLKNRKNYPSIIIKDALQLDIQLDENDVDDDQ